MQAMLCSENAKMAMNYLAFFISLPAWSAQNDYRNVASMLGNLHFDEDANDMVADSQGYAGYSTFAAVEQSLELE